MRGGSRRWRAGAVLVLAAAAALAIATTAALAEHHHGSKKVKGTWVNPVGSCVQHIISFDPATGDLVCTGTSDWTGTWKGSTAWKLTGNQDPGSGAVSGRIAEVFTGRAADGRKGGLTFVEHLELDAEGNIDITGHITHSCGALTGSSGHAHWVGTSSVADGSGHGPYTGRWQEGRSTHHKHCHAG
jgi:hypothetical protein